MKNLLLSLITLISATQAQALTMKCDVVNLTAALESSGERIGPIIGTNEIIQVAPNRNSDGHVMTFSDNGQILWEKAVDSIVPAVGGLTVRAGDSRLINLKAIDYGKAWVRSNLISYDGYFETGRGNNKRSEDVHCMEVKKTQTHR